MLGVSVDDQDCGQMHMTLFSCVCVCVAMEIQNQGASGSGSLANWPVPLAAHRPQRKLATGWGMPPGGGGQRGPLQPPGIQEGPWEGAECGVSQSAPAGTWVPALPSARGGLSPGRFNTPLAGDGICHAAGPGLLGAAQFSSLLAAFHVPPSLACDIQPRQMPPLLPKNEATSLAVA